MQSTAEGRFQERAKEHDVRSANIIAAKGQCKTVCFAFPPTTRHSILLPPVAARIFVARRAG
jgi:hypothetical protein